MQQYSTPSGQRLERPIKLYSRAFRGAELRWATNEQEAFAIYFALKKWRHLLLDKKFTIETDHANLAYITENTSPKVMRWRLAIDEFNFKLRHIPGESNTEADAASRMYVMRSMFRRKATLLAMTTRSAKRARTSEANNASLRSRRRTAPWTVR